MDLYHHERVCETSGLPAKFMVAESGDLTIPAHWHEYLEILYLLKGELTAVVQADSYLLTPKDLMIINSGELHMTQAKGEASYLLLQISVEQLQRFWPEDTIPRFQTMIPSKEQGAVYEVLHHCMKQMQETYTEQEKGYQLLFTANLYELLYHLYKNFCDSSPFAVGTGFCRDLQRIMQVMEWVRKNFQKTLTLDEAAAALAVSREHFCRLFKKYTGQTFLEYLNSVRTMHLYEELKNSDDSITVLMEKNGISNYKVFMRTFKKLYGDTPQRIRSGKKDS